MLIDCGGDDEYEYDDDRAEPVDTWDDALDVIEYELEEEYDGPYFAALIICPHCNSLTANVWPLPLAALQCDDCHHWIPMLAIGWVVEQLMEDA
jgi:hypothetical protein